MFFIKTNFDLISFALYGATDEYILIPLSLLLLVEGHLEGAFFVVFALNADDA